MLAKLMECHVEEASMESTSIYWMPVWRVLENYVSLKLVNPYFIKQLPGKKSDVKDAEWIATCLLKDLIKGSYVPEDLIQLRQAYLRPECRMRSQTGQARYCIATLQHPHQQLHVTYRHEKLQGGRASDI